MFRQVFGFFSVRGWFWIAVGMLYLAALVCCMNTVLPSKAAAASRIVLGASPATRPLRPHPATVATPVRPPQAVLGAFDII